MYKDGDLRSPVKVKSLFLNISFSQLYSLNHDTGDHATVGDKQPMYSPSGPALILLKKSKVTLIAAN